LANLFSFSPRKYSNSLRAKVLLHASDYGVRSAAREYNLQDRAVQRWVSIYANHTREELLEVTDGSYDTPDDFLIAMESATPYNSMLYHAVQCRLSGMRPEEYFTEFNVVDLDTFYPAYERIKRVPLDELGSLKNPRIRKTQINFENIISNLNRSVSALFEGAQVEHATPIMPKELQKIKKLKEDLEWAISQYDRTK
jgi:hypothetical protein